MSDFWRKNVLYVEKIQFPKDHLKARPHEKIEAGICVLVLLFFLGSVDLLSYLNEVVLSLEIILQSLCSCFTVVYPWRVYLETTMYTCLRLWVSLIWLCTSWARLALKNNAAALPLLAGSQGIVQRADLVYVTCSLWVYSETLAAPGAGWRGSMGCIHFADNTFDTPALQVVRLWPCTWRVAYILFNVVVTFLNNTT